MQLLDITRYCLSSGVQIEPWTIADGFGNAAEGHSILSRWKVLEPGQSDRLEASFFGVKAREKGEIYPLFIINGRMDGTRLLEPTVVESMTDINVGRFYYTHYATAIPDSTLFKFSEDDITVVSAAEVEQPTFVTYVPKEIPTGPISPPSAGSIEGGEVPQIVPPQ